MSTRALYTFKDENGEYHVYKHHDGYPTGALDAIKLPLTKKLVWELPRFEADEFAAGFIAANKTDGGSLRLTVGKTWQEAISGDAEYHYTITMRSGKLYVQVDSVNAWGSEPISTHMKSGSLSAVTTWAKKEGDK